MSFDGSCDPNPRGRMGWSYILTFADGRALQGHDEAPPNAANTVNVAEYRGLITGMQAYLAAGGRGSLTITGDSQLIINQVNGVYRVRNDVLKDLHAQVGELAQQIQGLSIMWNAREHNTAADMLARGSARQPESTASDTPDLYLRDDLQTSLPAALTAAIARLNSHPAPGFKDFAGLRTGGSDAFSKFGLDALRARVGSAAAELVAKQLDDPKSQAVALRWALRGLGVQRAIRKVQVDTDIAAQAQGRSSTAKPFRSRR
jgi:ribonuclease HI